MSDIFVVFCGIVGSLSATSFGSLEVSRAVYVSIGMMYIPVGGLPSWYMHGVSGIKAHLGITGSALSCCLCWWGVDGRLSVLAAMGFGGFCFLVVWVPGVG